MANDTNDVHDIQCVPNMIGNIGQLAGLGNVHALPAAVLNIPLPFFYTRDSGVALPTAALPYNDMRIQFTFRRLNELLIADCCQLPVANEPATPTGLVITQGTVAGAAAGAVIQAGRDAALRAGVVPEQAAEVQVRPPDPGPAAAHTQECVELADLAGDAAA